ncbi:MAG: hypothetical protein K2J36_09640 [Ruminococcus sp.]|nr:hypothetical protein [Ruminococcus sp.]
MIKFTDDLMKKSLASFGESYKYPVYASIDCRNSFFRSYNTKAGFVALTDSGKLLVSEYYVLGTEKKYILPLQNLEKIKIRKLAFLPIYKIKTLFVNDGKKFRMDIMISLKVYGHEFTEQAENTVNLIRTFQDWQNFLKR